MVRFYEYNTTMSYKIYPEDKLREGLTKYIRHKYPNVFFFNRLDQAKMSQARRNRFKAEGIATGLPDFEIINPRGKYYGLAIELKAKGKGAFSYMRNKRCLRIDNIDNMGLPTKEAQHLLDQAYNLHLYMLNGRLALFSEGLDQTIEIVDKYMAGAEWNGRLHDFTYCPNGYLPEKFSIPFNPINISA